MNALIEQDEQKIETKANRVKLILNHPHVTANHHDLLQLRMDRLRIDGLTNLVAAAEAEMKNIAMKYLGQHFQELDSEVYLNG